MLQYASIIYYHDIMSNNRKNFKSKLDKHTNIVAHHLNNAPYFGPIVSETSKRAN